MTLCKIEMRSLGIGWQVRCLAVVSGDVWVILHKIWFCWKY